MDSTNSKQDFVFIHVVDSCPGSASLELLMRRMHLNLRSFRRDLGEICVSATNPETFSDLRQQHHNFLNESARKYPDKSFIFIIDAVNQLHEDLQVTRCK